MQTKEKWTDETYKMIAKKLPVEVDFGWYYGVCALDISCDSFPERKEELIGYRMECGMLAYCVNVVNENYTQVIDEILSYIRKPYAGIDTVKKYRQHQKELYAN